MEQDSRSSESRERAVSSEPSSTRPNPFDDGDLAARKRRRTSLTGSRSRSVETLTSQDERRGASDSMMKLDAPDPEPAPPSTPPQSEPTIAEPHSSKVTINLRNFDSLEPTPTSPPSPTPARSQDDDIKVSVEESEVEMVQATPPQVILSSSPSSAPSPEVPVISIDDDDEEELDLGAGHPAISMIGGASSIDLNSIMQDFPYHAAEETYYDTVVRLVQYFQQQPTSLDDVLAQMTAWFDKYLFCACEPDMCKAAVESVFENRSFWLSMPEIFWHVYLRRNTLAKARDTRDLAGQLFAQLARLSAHFVVLDILALQRVLVDEDFKELYLMSPTFLICLGNVTRKEESELYNGYAVETVPEVTELLHIFQKFPGGSMSKLYQLAELQTSLLSRFPRATMDNLMGICNIADGIIRDSFQRLSSSPGLSHSLDDRSRKNLVWGFRLFKTASSAVATIMDKSVNHLSGDSAHALIRFLTPIFLYSLQGDHEEAAKLVQEHRANHPEAPHSCTYDAISNEWRFGVLSNLIRSRQMQLRVVAVGCMSNDLVGLWKRCSNAGEDSAQSEYLRYFAIFLTNTGLVDYILGPTCHPEITQESSNIIGFLMVTKTYAPAQTDLFWQTVTSTQDPRIAEALTRMLAKILHLMYPDSLAYLCEKLHSLPIEAFTPQMRELFDQLVKALHSRMALSGPAHEFTPYRLCLRLLRESSVYGQQGLIAHPDVHQFAMAKIKELLQLPGGMSAEIRSDLLRSCISDIEAKTTTTSGSLSGLYMMIRQSLVRDLTSLVTEFDFARLLVDELESTIAIARGVGFVPVFAAQIGNARRELLVNTIVNHGSTINSDQGKRLWDLLVGNGAACQDDRKMAWQVLNTAVKRSDCENAFLRACLQEYLLDLPPRCYCEGALEFVRAELLPLANDTNGILFEDGSAEARVIELLWQMILRAPAQTIESQAIHTLVNDVYVDSKSIMSFPLHRARKVHFSVVNRCLQQLEAAAQKLKAYGDDISSRDDDSMVIVPSEEQQREQELKFTRSLAVLRAFLRTLQGKAHFAAPDLRSLMLQSPGPVEGESAELKYQSFDGDSQTEVKPLTIGRRNTAAALLASLREATGFDNYRIFYRGVALTPSEDQICKSLEDLDIHDGLILVKREMVSSPVKVKPGASSLEIEILSHFKDLWEYLSMDEKLAREIYHFLVKLPADQSILEAFEASSTSYRDIFPLGQPFKSLYAIHALREYLSTRRLKTQVMQVSIQDAESQYKTALDQEDATLKAMSLLVAALCDSEVVDRCSHETLQVLLCDHLVDNFVQLLKENANSNPSVVPFLTAKLHERLLAILGIGVAAQTSPQSLELISLSFEAMLECCTRSLDFWNVFRQTPTVKAVVQRLLLTDDRSFVRKAVAKLMSSKCFYNHGPSVVLAVDFAELFWSMISEIIPRAAAESSKCEEVFNMSYLLMKHLAEANSPALDLPMCLSQYGELLLSHTTVEDISRSDRIDVISHGLISMLHHGIKVSCARNEPLRFPQGFAHKLFFKHLFAGNSDNGPLIPQILLNSHARNMLCETILVLAKTTRRQYIELLQDVESLTTPTRDHPYKYELPQQFDRTKVVRSPCGYSGLRNLSNTCYLNSLFTQLFMNVGFRRFILDTPCPNPDTHQLLYETRNLFATLQDSVRKFVDPQMCVAQIMTYDETPIDIHNQMDVDEFYNLLFDRWEAQMPTDIAKKALRSIFGGQLVQQVKSNECEHISERMEPFSAIQCDIKGKASLEESLQAYVDGEIMEGDNKYKCESCDRHVDAVKRACLKDVPDNLIFHLKRFDFNLRTLQRNKINDYFRFPNQIDMQPYTVEHLSDPSGTAEPDVFELVGVLVHSGNAESGHYYSFIRERPSTSAAETWVEFNDDVVNSWDPAHIESACFGGPDYRQFDNSGVYEKVYSAYMLFYQRSSCLENEQEMLNSSGRPSPLRFNLPSDLQYQVKSDNWALVQRHVLYDPIHIPFVYKVVSQAWDSEQCSENHQVENLALQAALGHLDQVASRSKDTPDFEGLYRLLVRVCRRCPRCCFTLTDYFTTHEEPLRMLLQKNADGVIRQEMGNMLIFALKNIRTHYPEDYGVPDPDDDASHDFKFRERCPLTNMAILFTLLWDTFHTSLRAWGEYFGTMTDFAQLGRPEAVALLDQDFLYKTIMVIAADPTFDLEPQYARMHTTISRRMATRPPNYENVIALIDTLMDVMDPKLHFAEFSDLRLPLALQDEPVPYNAAEVNLIHREWNRNAQGSVFVEKLIQINQNHVSTDAILTRLMDFSPQMDQRIFLTLRLGITGGLVTHAIGPYLRAAAHYVHHSSNAEHVERLIKHVCKQCKNIQGPDGADFFEFIKDTFSSSRRIQEDFEKVEIESLDLLPSWAPGLLGYIDHAVSYDVTLFLRQQLFREGAVPGSEEDEPSQEKCQAINNAARRLAIECLLYLQDTYVRRGVQAPKDTVLPLTQVIKMCGNFFNTDEGRDDGMRVQYEGLCQAVNEPMTRLMVDEIEEDGSDWDNSIGSSEQMDSLADLSMQATCDVNDRDLP
ncbi:uncharacterized protein BCR38DRAFT_488847 [Pseudomassariella vexata]|uniref:USP domain-containing protein n=1 Tax=Pseudomassariella vexata TaxID=1141098 RepID=A0A1Y2DIZ4_9PEZI|nr:uncharacterized protein BCR38DRAFT_488847 [Pseudomassariella vexata]ORY59104.1 hypothetical protein BCR38DRAFT_488847 [Pseudomassariella vexata]